MVICRDAATHLSREECAVDSVFGAHSIALAPVEMELAQPVLVQQRTATQS